MRPGLAVLAFAALASCEAERPLQHPCGTFTDAVRVPRGSPRGHADPAGARAARQARAGRIDDPASLRRAADARHPLRAGDFLLANDRIAVYIEGARPSDGYAPFGGEILALETYGPDGQPRGASQYGESLLSLSGLMVAPDEVSVVADGSDGGEAIVRASGILRPLRFMDTFSGLFGDRWELPAALDYVLSPGEARVRLRFHLLNTRAQPIDLGPPAEVLGFFHTSRGKTFSDVDGYHVAVGMVPGFVAWDGGASAFAFRLRDGRTMQFSIDESGFQLFFGSGGSLPSCQESVLDYAELVVGDSLDDLRQNLRALDGEPAARAISVQVRDGAGAPVAGAYVHAVGADGVYSTRATTAADGGATLHAPGAVTLQATASGYEPSAARSIAAGETTATLALPGHGAIEVDAVEAGSRAALPVRVIVLPEGAAPAALPASYGVTLPAFGRWHQVFTETGRAHLAVPEGRYRVLVSRGYEYELAERTIDVVAGAATPVSVALVHSVDTTGAMSSDFHIHSFYSMDSSDPVLDKVRSTLAEGIDIPVSSEHEYVIDFQPVIESLGATRWAHGLSSEELTTFVWGHFGVVPRVPDPALPNRGAIDWIGKQPGEVFAAVRALAEQPALIVNHPYSSTFQAYFIAAAFDQATATGDPSIYSDDFDALEVCNDSDVEANRKGSIAAWFSLLNHGRRVFAVGSSDSHSIRSAPPGYPRTYLELGHDDPSRVTGDAVRDAVKGGRAVIGGGLYMTVAGPGGVRPGGTIAGAAGNLTFEVAVRAPGWIDAETLEVIVDGKTVQEITLQPSTGAGPGRRWDAPVDVAVPAEAIAGGRHWVVFHAASSQDLAPITPGRHPFALSNPIFF